MGAPNLVHRRECDFPGYAGVSKSHFDMICIAAIYSPEGYDFSEPKTSYEMEGIRRVAGGFIDFYIECTKGNGRSMNWGALSTICGKMVIVIHRVPKNLLLIPWA